MPVVNSNIVTEVSLMGAGGAACALALNEINTAFAGLGIDSSSDASLGALSVTSLAASGAVTAGTVSAGGLTSSNGIIIGSSGGAGSVAQLSNRLTGVADNTATPVFEFSIPAGSHAAGFRVLLLATMNGDTDTFESSRVAAGTGVIVRQAADDAVAAVSALTGAAIATGGSGTITLAYAITTPTAGAGATTCSLTVTVVKTGTVTDHTVVAFIELLNSEASGITVGAP